MEQQLQISQDKFCTMQSRMTDGEVEKEEECQLKDQKLNVTAPVMMEASYSIHTHTHTHTCTHMHTCPWQPGLLTGIFTDDRLFHNNVPSTMTFILNQK